MQLSWIIGKVYANVPQRTGWRRDIISCKPADTDFSDAFTSFQNILQKTWKMVAEFNQELVLQKQLHVRDYVTSATKHQLQEENL